MFRTRSSSVIRRARRLSFRSTLDRLEDRTLLSSGPIISEFVASNSGGLADSDGSHPDWLEIYNPTSATVDLKGWALTDDSQTPNKWLFPETTLASGGFLVVFASAKNRAVAGQELHTNFKISSTAGGYLALDQPDGTVASVFDGYPAQTPNVSYGVGFQSTTLVTGGISTDVKVPTTSALESTWNTPAYTPDASWIHGQTGVGYGILQPGFSVHYVKANTLVDSVAKANQVLSDPTLQTKSVTTSANTINYLGTGGGANFSGDQPFPTQTINTDVDDFAIQATGLVTIPTAGNYSFGVNSDDGFSLTLERNGTTLSMSFDGFRGAADSIQVFNVPTAGQWKATLVFFERNGGSEVEFFAAPGAYSSFSGGVFDLVGDTSSGGLSVGSVLSDDPGDSSMVAKFVADDLNSLSNDAKVSTWTDRDPNGDGAILATSFGSPKLDKNALNGHSAVKFDPSDGGDNLRISASKNPISGDFTAAIVFRTSIAGMGPVSHWYTNSGLVDTLAGPGTNTWGIAFNGAGQISAGLGNPDVSVYSHTKGLNDGQAHLAVITRQGGELIVYVDGRLESEREDTSVIARTLDDIVFGSLQTNANFFTGEIAEVRLYNNDLTADQVVRLAIEMNQTYGLPGVATPTVATDVRSTMQGVNSTVYVRIPFTSPDPAQFDALTLQMQYDDGFVAYLNGVEVARSNAPVIPTFNSAAIAAKNSDPTVTETFSLTSHLNLLHAGTNLLAIRGLNLSAFDEDILIRPALIGSKLLSNTPSYFATPTPDAPNGTPYLGLVAAPKASVAHGFFNVPFSVSITTSTPGATIVYTLDGSEPNATNGTVYMAALTVSKTTTLRMFSYETGYLTQPTTTVTYLFLSDVLTQSPQGQAPAGWPTTWGSNDVDYGLDPNIVNDPTYGGAALKSALLALPTISLTTDLPNLFDATTGIYANAYQQGKDWERKASVELINPDGSAGFQIDAGLRIRGGYSRSGGNPKHAFRLFFRSEYGASTLDYPLFGSEGAGSFAKMDLRTAENYSWSFGGDPSNNMVAEVVARDIMREMNDPYTRSRWYHLYLDGQYWGLYQTEERPEANYAATYLGGDSGNYDVIKVETGPYTTQATDGNFDAWNRLWQAATDTTLPLSNNANYYRIQGKNANGTANPDNEVLVDINNLIDFMMNILYGGNLDAPISNFLGNNSPNNFFAIRDRTGRAGFQFIIHDAEHTLLDVNQDRNGPFPAGSEFPKFNPQYLHQQLMANAEYRLKFADAVQKQFFNGGVFTPGRIKAAFQSRANEIAVAMDGESARWGDAKRPGNALTVADWQAAVNRVLFQYLPDRTAIVLDQFRANSLFPNLAAPTFLVNNTNEHGGTIGLGDILSLNGPAGATIYYTLDGSDPRLLGGGISPTALIATGSITLTSTAKVITRSYQAGTWSASDFAQFNLNIPATSSSLKITEFDYHPLAADLNRGELNVAKDEFEFIELKNLGATEINLAGVQFTAGIGFDFTNAAINTLAPSAYVLVVKNIDAFTSRYGTGLPVAGSYGSAIGSLNNLSNKSEEIKLIGASGATIEDFTYSDSAPWPTQADGGGSSLVNIKITGDPNDAANWRASVLTGGNPGYSDNTSPTISSIAAQTINEDTNTGDLTFTISDVETAVSSLVVTAQSNNDILLPTGSIVLAGSGTNRTVRISPAALKSGVATITIVVKDTDGGLTLTTFPLTVTAVNHPPVGVAESYTTAEETPLIVSASTGVLINDTDLDGDVLTAILGQSPAHGSLTLNPNGSFRYTPAANYNGSDSFTYRPNDGVAVVPFVTVGLTITSVLDPVLLDPIPNKTVDELTTLSFTPNATDGDLPNDTLTFSLDSGAPTGATIDSKTGVFSWTPTEAQGPGTYTITMRAIDTDPSSATRTFQVTVNEVNSAPSIPNLGLQTIDEGTLFTVPISAVDSDLPKQTISYTLDAGAPIGASIDGKTGVFSWTPTEAQGPGRFAITVRATDNGSPAMSGTSTFNVTVNEVNRKPVLATIPAKTVNELATLTFIAVATDPDLPQQTITYSLAPGAPAGATIDVNSGVFSWTPIESDGPGSYHVVVMASDGSLSDSLSVAVTVDEVNRPPVLATFAEKSVVQGSSIGSMSVASDPDLPANILRFSLDPSSVAGSKIDATTGQVTWVTSTSQATGRFPIIVRVSDSGVPNLSTTQTLFITVTAAPPPAIDLGNTTAPVVVGSDGSLTYQGRVTGASSATINYGDGSATQPLSISANGVFALDHSYTNGGTYTVTVAVTGGSGSISTGTITVNVASRPLVTIAPGSLSTTKKGVTSLVLNFSDAVNSAQANNSVSYRLVTAGKDKKFGTKDDKVVAIGSAAYNPSTHVVTLTVKKKLPTGAIRLIVPTGNLTDTTGRAIDGNRDGQPGGDFQANVGKRSLTIASFFHASRKLAR